MNRRALAVVIAAGLALGGAGVVLAQAQAKRTMLQAIDVAGTTRQANLGTAEIPAGGKVPRHTHPGEELGLVLEGQVTVKIAGQPDRVLKAGDSFVVPKGVVHEADAGSGGKVKISSVWIIEKGQPLAAPAP